MGNPQLSDHRLQLQAVFSDIAGFIDIDSVIHDNLPLSKSTTKGFYRYVTDNPNYHNTNINWHLYDYDGMNHTISQTQSTRLKITSPSKTDTVSKSGFNLDYTGSHGYGDITLVLDSGRLLNWEFGINDSLDPQGSISKTFFALDNGTISLTSQDLIDFEPDRYYICSIKHHLLDSTVVNGKKGMLYSSTSTDQYFYLTN
jgi:hypothetical protein